MGDDLTPLSQPLNSSEMLSAFSITPEPHRNTIDVNPASENTLSSIRVDGGGEEEEDGSDIVADDSSDSASKRPRLVWTPELHKLFVDAVAQLGLKNAVPKDIVQLMKIEGLTRENVANHLQKYRLYLRRMQDFKSSDNRPNQSSQTGPREQSSPQPD